MVATIACKKMHAIAYISLTISQYLHMKTNFKRYKSTCTYKFILGIGFFSGLLAPLSIFSIASIGSIGSVASIFSAGSVLSIVSFASFNSLFSIMSTNSKFSVLSNNCEHAFYKDCKTAHTKPPSTASVHIEVSDEVWATMAKCSFEDYKYANPRPDKCDYQPCNARFTGFKNIRSNITIGCKIRRKGTSTWRKMGHKPSYKIKLDEELHFGNYACRDNCPIGLATNQWKSKKFTLNNGVDNSAFGEHDAYQEFARLGVRGVPLALLVDVNVSSITTKHSPNWYTMIETIDDKAFMKKWFGKNYALWEIEKDLTKHVAQKFERSGGNVDVNKDTHVITVTENGTSMHFPTPDFVTNFTLDKQNIENAVKYYVGEVITGHWDGFCLRHDFKPNNVYIAYDKAHYWIIPSGLDRTFQTCEKHRHRKP